MPGLMILHIISNERFYGAYHLYEKIYSKNRDVAHMIFSIDEVKLIEKFTVEGVI